MTEHSTIHCSPPAVASSRRGEGTVTRLPGALVARYRGEQRSGARLFRSALTTLRPHVAGRVAVPPRIWGT
jgi:urease accessory protein